MVRSSLVLLATLGGVAVCCAEGNGQTTSRGGTTNRSTSSTQGASSNRSTSSGSAASASSSISQSVSGLSSAVPALQQSQNLRDTGTRGAFVGAEASELPQGTGTASGTNTRRAGQGMNTRSTQVRQPEMQTGRGAAYGRQTATAIQPTLTLGFVPAAASAADLQRNAAAAVRRVPMLSDYASVGVRVEGGSVILEGTVGSQHQRALISQLVALEPGVIQVDNRLVVPSAPGGAR